MLINCRLNPLSSCYGRFHFPYAYSPSLSSTSGGDETRKRSFVTVSHLTHTHTFVPPLTGCSILPCDRKRVQPGTLVHVPGEVGHVMKTILC